MPSWAPRPVPTSRAVGVARPERARAGDDQHRDRGGERRSAAAAGEQPAGQGQQRRGRARPARRPPRSGRPAAAPSALPLCASSTSRAIWASWVSAPTRVGAHDQPPPALTVAPVTASPGPDLDRHRLAGEQRRVDGRRARADDAVGRDLLPGPDDERSPTDQLSAGTCSSRRRGARATSLAPSASRLAAPPRPGAWPRLEPAAEQQEGRDHGRDLEVGRVLEPARPARPTDQRVRRP